jgi:2-amino-4-hydroxy-6-hydroxymethyldihydropteridine diphosphokinase
MYRKQKLSENLEIYSSSCFPYRSKKNSSHRYRATIGIGGNVGDVKRRFHHLFVFLQKDKRVDIVQTSLILKNPPFGYLDQDDFLNSIIILKTSMRPQAFLTYLLRLEKKYGRKRSFANAPRSLDLDIIFFDKLKIETKSLILPHPHWYKRESVTIPLASLLK